MIALLEQTRKEGSLGPLIVCTIIEVATEIYFVRLFGWTVFHRVYFWPGLILCAFWIQCLLFRRHQPWHRIFWRFACIWSGLWTIWGLLFTYILPLALVVPFPAWPWLEETGVHLLTLRRVERLRQCGLYPERGTATLADVERLLKAGYSTLAIRCYREIHGGSIAEAKKTIHTQFARQKP